MEMDVNNSPTVFDTVRLSWGTRLRGTVEASTMISSLLVGD